MQTMQGQADPKAAVSKESGRGRWAVCGALWWGGGGYRDDVSGEGAGREGIESVVGGLRAGGDCGEVRDGGRDGVGDAVSGVAWASWVGEGARVWEWGGIRGGGGA
jgi:hypothetical protein